MFCLYSFEMFCLRGEGTSFEGLKGTAEVRFGKIYCTMHAAGQRNLRMESNQVSGLLMTSIFRSSMNWAAR